MYAEERRTLLVQIAHGEGRVQVTEAAARFDVTPETIRRDLEVLDRHGILRRVHGGAMPATILQLGDLALAEREKSHSEQKDRIAQAAVRLLPEQPYASVLVDSGTTTGRLAAQVPTETRLSFFTNSLPIAASLSSRTSADVQLLGGRVKGLTQACVGGALVTALARLHTDVCFIAANGLSLEHGLSTPDAEEAVVKEQMVARSRRTIALVDSSKFGTQTACTFAPLDAIDVLVTDAITPRQSEALTQQGIEVVLA